MDEAASYTRRPEIDVELVYSLGSQHRFRADAKSLFE